MTDDYSFAFGAYNLEQTLRAPHLIDAILSPYVLHLVSEYLGCPPTIYSVQAWWSIPLGIQAETQQYHRDFDDFRFLTLFIYLTDVNESNGPHCYLRGSHVGEGQGEDLIIGPAGTTILVDTYGLHKGMSPTENRRLVASSPGSVTACTEITTLGPTVLNPPVVPWSRIESPSTRKRSTSPGSCSRIKN